MGSRMLAAFLAAIPASSSLAFAQQYGWHSRPAGSALARIALCDFDRDGRLDVLATDPDARTIVFAAGRLGPSYGAPLAYNMSAAPRELACADLDGDGGIDVVAAAPSEQALVLRMSKLPFGLLAEELLDQTDDCNGVVLVDTNGDGALDIAVTRRVTKKVALYANTAGNFESAVLVNAGRQVELLASADMNGDGKPDFLASSKEPDDPDEDRLTLLRKQPTGAAYAIDAHIAVAKGVVGIAPADYDSDGDVDVVVAGATFDEANVLFGNGDGDIELATGFALASEPRSVRAFDLDGDGAPDLVLAHAAGEHAIAPLRNTGAGEFEALGAGYAIGAPCVDAHALDLDGDAAIDFVAARADGRIELVLGDGAGASPGRLALPAGNAPHLALLDEDALPDLVLEHEGKLVVHAGVAAGGFDAQAFHVQHAAGVSHITSLDFDLDGRLDLFADAPAGLSVRWYTNLGAGQFAYAGEYFSEVAHTAIRSGDFDGDGRPDLLLVDADGGSDSSRLFLNRLQLGYVLQVIVDVGYCPCEGIAVLDVDHDGRDDVATSLAPEGRAVYYRGLGVQGFGPAVALQGLTGVAMPLAGDVNGDGTQDLVYPLTAPDGGFHLLPGISSGGFGASALIPTSALVAPRLADLSGDGRLDLVDQGRVLVATPNAQFVEWLRTEVPTSGPIADVDADGRVDLVVASGPGATAPFVQLDLTTGASGTHAFGVGVPGCAGAHSIALSAPAEIGTASAVLTSSHAEPGGFGVGFVGAAPRYLGDASLGLGVPLYLSVAAAPGAFVFPLVANAQGVGARLLPVPPASELIGVRVWSQVLWLWSAPSCQPSQPFGLSATPGLEVQIQP
ncbi:MAG: VCBS repeat-containing protein [Planctomycetota bacterium]|nr:MAG: VCBS repeat-containing protein [Planctomycetota bacterium]